jgi:hypothetical protein
LVQIGQLDISRIDDVSIEDVGKALRAHDEWGAAERRLIERRRAARR